ncbi:MAG: hypothetical protein NTV07_03255 [Candidatus Omnitrophica bacterium]|nr:hypothetical protein [Candidatus Omnitrophota bacterium]
MIKKSGVVLSVSLFSSILFGCVAAAAPVGNPAGPVLLEGNYPTKFSLEAETVLERRLDTPSYSGKPKYKGMLYMGKVSFYLGKKLDFYGLIGVQEGRVSDFADPSKFRIITKMVGAWGFGMSYVLHAWEFNKGLVRLGADAKFREFRPEMKDIQLGGNAINTIDESLRVKEWQTSLGLSYQYKKFIPYCGIKYSDVGMHLKFKDNRTGINYSDTQITSKNKVGLFYGFDTLLSDNLSLNVEGRCIDETAANIGFNARF